MRHFSCLFSLFFFLAMKYRYEINTLVLIPDTPSAKGRRVQ